jgi:hypothetical protein
MDNTTLVIIILVVIVLGMVEDAGSKAGHNG